MKNDIYQMSLKLLATQPLKDTNVNIIYVKLQKKFFLIYATHQENFYLSISSYISLF